MQPAIREPTFSAMHPPTLDTTQLAQKTFVARLEHHGTLGSTNDRAKQCVAEGPGPLPLLIVADEQTAGRGRGTNRWWTGRGSLAFSLLVDTAEMGIDRSRWPMVSLAAGVAIVDTVAPWLPSCPVGLHWPNDVFAGGRKLAGVLVEILANRFCVVGIGLNTNNSLQEAPQELQETATTLLELTGTRHDHTTLLLVLLERLADMFRQLASAPEQVAARANRACLQHGQRLTIQSGRRAITGLCTGIAADGALLLDTPDGQEKLYSGVSRHTAAASG